MSLISALAVYFILWWLVLFAVLPFRVRNAAEAGQDVPDGHDPGAPIKDGMGWKAKVTTLVATALFLPLYWFLSVNGLEGLANLFGAPSI